MEDSLDSLPDGGGSSDGDAGSHGDLDILPASDGEVGADIAAPSPVAAPADGAGPQHPSWKLEPPTPSTGRECGICLMRHGHEHGPRKSMPYFWLVMGVCVPIVLLRPRRPGWVARGVGPWPLQRSC